jgi:hypothetical protein
LQNVGQLGDFADFRVASTAESVTLPSRMIVSKATSVYVIMVVALIGGLWFILALGSTLVPPKDLAGKWELEGNKGSQDLSVEQSGKFIDLVMGKWTASLKIQPNGNLNPKGQSGVLMVGNGQSVRFEGLGIDDKCTIRFDGALSGVYQAHRVTRTSH